MSSKAMTKEALVELLAKEAGIPKSKALKVLEALINTAQNELKQKGIFSLSGFATFEVYKSKPRKSYDLKTGKIKNFPSRKRVRLKLHKRLKEMIGKE